MRAIVFAFSVLLWIAPRSAGAQETPVCDGTVDGHVVDARGHEPVAGAMVQVNDELVTITDAAGRFILSGRCRGHLDIRVERADYETATRSVDLQGHLSLEIELKAGMGEIVVIRGNVLAPLDMQATAVVSGEALERTRGRSFSDALAEVPGVAQLRSGSGMSKPIVRGQFGRRLLLLVDSVQHRSQNWGLDHAPEVDPFVAGTLKVVRGAAGVRYGPGAIGGAVIAEPPKLLSTPGYMGEAHLMGFLARGAGLATRLQVAPASLPGVTFQVEGTAKRLASSSTPDYALENTASGDWTLGGTVGYRSATGEYIVSYRHYQARLGVCACLQIESSDDFFAQLERERPANAARYQARLTIDRPYQAVAHEQAQARATWPIGKVGKLRASYALQFDHRREYEVVRDASGPQFDFRLTTHDVNLALEHKPVHFNDHLHLDGSLGLAGLAQVNSYRGLPLIPDYEAASGGAYVIERLIAHDYEIEAGLRYDLMSRRASILRNDFLRLVRSEQIESSACGGDDADPVTCTSLFHTLSASLGALVRLRESLSVKADLSSASRPPSPDEQYLNGTSPTFPVLGLGKPDLQPETTYSASLTASYQGERVAAEASIYANYISDYIYFAPAIGPDGNPIVDVLIRGSFPRFVTRPVDAVFYGADGGVSIQPTASLSLGAQFSMVRARNRSNDSYLVFIPSDRGRLSSTYTFSADDNKDKFYMSASTSYVARQARFDIAADLASPPDAYWLVDAEFGGDFQIGDQLTKLSVQATNLLGQRYRDYTSMLRYFADQPGTEVMIKLSFFMDGAASPTPAGSLYEKEEEL